MKKILLWALCIGCFSLVQAQSISLDYSFNPTCNNGANGGFCLINSGFLGTINYTLSPGGAMNTTGCFNYLASGTYTISAADSFSNTASTTVTLASSTSPIITSINPVPCSNEVGVSITGATSPYTLYSVPAGSFNSNTQSIQLYSGNGIYTITAIDANGCSATTVYTLNFTPSNITATRSFPNTNCTSINYDLCETATGGVAPYTYTINTNSNTTGCFTGLNFNSYYNVEVVDNIGCKYVDSLSVANATPYFDVSTQNPSTCVSPDGSLCVINPQMVALPLQYALNGGAYQSTNCFNNLPGGTYTISILDASNCSATQLVELIAPGPYGYTVQTPTPCNASTGQICINGVFGGTPPYVYTLNSTLSQSSNCFNNLGAGSYILTITDALGCTYNLNESVTNPTFLNYPNTTNALCNGGTGTATFTLGGTYVAPVSFNLMPGNITNATGYFSGLTSGSYTLNATDGAGCVNSKVFYINLTTYLGALGYTASPGSITLSNAGLTAPIQYSFDNVTTSNNVFTGFCSGWHYFSATDANGCYKTDYATLTSMNTFPGSTITSNVIDQYCPSSNTGSIDVIINPTGNYTYEMVAPQYVNNGSSSLFSALNAGQYDINIFDASSNCVSKSYTLNTGNNVCGVVNGKVFHDANSDCIANPGEINLSNQLIIMAPGNHITYTDPNGQFQFYNKSFNAYNLMQIPSNYFTPSQICGTSYPLILNTGNTTEYREFADSLYNTSMDLISLITPATFVPGFNSSFSVSYYNAHPYISANGNITLTLDPNLNFVSASPAPSSISGNTLTWNFTNLLNPYTPTQIHVTTFTPTNVGINTPINNCSHINLTSGVDVNLANNVSCANTLVVSSFDPNEIIVSPHGIGTPGYIGKDDSVLTYRINFQNTGTAPAHRVVVVDSLPSELYLRKFKVIDYSHMYTIQVDEQGVMSFVFDNIMLPDKLFFWST